MTIKTAEPWGPTGYEPGISVETWIKLLNNPEIFTPARKEVLKRLKACVNGASCKQLADRYGEKCQFYITNAAQLAKRVFQDTNCHVHHREDGSIQYWAILFWGRYEQGGKLFSWKLRDELAKALDQIDLSDVPLFEQFPQEENQALLSQCADLSDLERAARHYASNHPVRQEVTIGQFRRSESVKQYVKTIANGHCQLCGEKAPFNDANGVPYLEVHHIKWLADGGSDTIENTVALCPNCHRRMHILQSPDDKEQLLKSVSERNG